jgi:hypothetical protein
MSKFKKTSKVHFRNILPTTFENKALGYHKFGWNDNLPLEIIDIINNSGTAKKAAKKYAEYIESDGFVSEQASFFKVNEKETADKLLSKAALSFAYMDCAVFHISRLGNGRVGKATLMPFQKIRKSLDGNWMYNPTIGLEKLDKNAWIKLQDFQGEVASFEAMTKNITDFNSNGEIYYVFDGNPFDSDVYAIPDFLASVEDVKTSSELSKMDYEAVLNGFNLGGVMTFFGVDDNEKGEDGLTDRQRIEGEMVQFTGMKKNKDGLTSRFAVLVNFAEMAEQAPIFSGNDPKPILEASNSKRDIIERAVCRLWGVHPVLLGYAEAAVLGNDNAIKQAMAMLRQTVNPVQRLITQAFRNMFGAQIDWTISEFGVEINIPREGDKILGTLNALSPLLATKVIDLIPKQTLLDALGIETDSTTIEQAPQ